ncbi:hypothetical protein [Haloarchaeobius iranensis]|uniref:Transglutaminase-like superfamily protein n=1 Tax=Haloarchaeobius iranensis TaxID=996166 RepID=A0A1H0A5F7_9EURY|nr:hypothetical protein [Haloarchaeobius iranensis]SDN27966.1 hypothetical protein SAMN05192554_12432 [Haloarchaeobius iranensis]
MPDNAPSNDPRNHPSPQHGYERTACRADGGRSTRGWADGFDGWAAAAKPESTDAEYSRSFHWCHAGERRELTLSIPVGTYDYCVNRARTGDYRQYVVDPLQEPFIATVAEDIEETMPGGTARDTVTSCVRFVQSLEYIRDREDTGHEAYPKYPVETLVHQRGDCEDGTLLLCALLETLGYDTAVLVLPAHHHMVAGVACDWGHGASVTHQGTQFFTVETTTSGWDIGELDPQFQGSPVDVHRPDDTPILVHQWDATPTTETGVTVTVHAANFGSAPVEDVQVRFLFERRNGTIAERVWLGDGSRTLAAGESTQFIRDIVPPPDLQLRGRCRLIAAGALHDESESEWH